MICFNVKKVTIIEGRGADKVSFHTLDDSPIPAITDEPLCLDFLVEAGDGYRYVTKVLGLDPRLVERISI